MQNSCNNSTSKLKSCKELNVVDCANCIKCRAIRNKRSSLQHTKKEKKKRTPRTGWWIVYKPTEWTNERTNEYMYLHVIRKRTAAAPIAATATQHRTDRLTTKAMKNQNKKYKYETAILHGAYIYSKQHTSNYRVRRAHTHTRWILCNVCDWVQCGQLIAYCSAYRHRCVCLYYVYAYKCAVHVDNGQPFVRPHYTSSASLSWFIYKISLFLSWQFRAWSV